MAVIGKRKSPTLGDLTSGSPWALISLFPAVFQRRLGHATSDRGHQAKPPVFMGVTIPLFIILAETT